MKWEHFGDFFFFFGKFSHLGNRNKRNRNIFLGDVFFFVANFHILATERNENGNIFLTHIRIFK